MVSEEVYQASEPGEPIDIILPTHGKLQTLTIPCVQALYAHTKAPFHLIVVDDSTPNMTEVSDDGKETINDATPQFFKRFQIEHTNITFMHSDTPFKSGNQFFNIALGECKNRFVATVMNSIRVEPDWDIVPIRMMAENPKIGIIGMKCLMGHNGLIESAGIRMVGVLPCDIGRDWPSHRLFGSYPCFSLQWAFALLRKEAVLGNLQEIWEGFCGWDDIDNTVYLRYKGWEAWYCGLGVGYHFTHTTRGSSEEMVLLKNRMNAEIFYKRWGYWDEFKKANPYAPEFYQNGKVEFLANANSLPLTRQGSLLEKATS